MSLQRGESIRGWGGVTKNLATNTAERNAWSLWLFGFIFVAVIIGLIGFMLSQADIPVLAGAVLIALALLGTLVLLTGIYSSMVHRAKAGPGRYDEPIEVIGGGYGSSGSGSAVAPEPAFDAAAEAARQQAERDAAAAAAQAAEAERQQTARAAALERERAEAEARAAAEAAKTAKAEDMAVADAAEPVSEGVRPAGLDAPMDGKADDLKLIKGVGPKLEELCNSLGFYHFSQIAAWTGDEIAWVDSNLEGFSGRVSRDDWVAQAKILAAGGETEFSSRQ